jgi:hypothetical protein
MPSDKTLTPLPESVDVAILGAGYTGPSGAPLGLYNGRAWFLPFARLWPDALDWIE